MDTLRVLVVGGGISGMGTAHLLARLGYHVYLLDSAPGIGGSFHLLDRTFSTNYCGICIMLPEQPSYCPTYEADTHPNVEIIAYADLKSLEGEPGEFEAQVLRKPRYVDIEACNRCGKCTEVCPESRPGLYEGTISPQKAIYPPPARAVPNAFVIDMDVCTRCGKCVTACPENAIDLNMEPVVSHLNVGAAVLSPGFEPFDVRRRSEFGWGHFPNVLTSIQFERMASLTGSTMARLIRPSDGNTVKKIGFIHCVGSRDKEKGNDFCSSACCMYTAKQITMAKEKYPDLEVTVFTMDVRTFGKGFEEYMDKVMAFDGVTYKRCMVSSIYQYQQSGDLYLNYLNDQGILSQEEFDMIVLAVGLDHPKGAEELAQAAGIELNQWLFPVTGPFTTRDSTRTGVFIGGAFHEPMDIPEVTADSSAAATGVVRLLGLPENGAEETATAAERDIEGEDEKLGVFLCKCNDTLTHLLDYASLQSHAEGIPHVRYTELVDEACSPEGIGRLAETIREKGLNRIVVAGCTHRKYAAEFAAMMEQAGLNGGLLERANIREGVAWTAGRKDDGSAATITAQSVIEIAAAKARHHQVIDRETHQLHPRVLVVGGGITGMTAALSLGEMGYPVDLVERDNRLGGNLLNSYYTIQGGDVQKLLKDTVQTATAADALTIHLETEVTGFSGTVGNFSVQLTGVDGSVEEETFGAVVMATGGQTSATNEYLYGTNERVLTQKELEKKLSAGQADPDWKTVAMIQCVGSRDELHPWCSRVCCSHAVKNALKLKEQSPDTEVYVLYRDIRTYGFMEIAYQQAREAGVVFLRYDLPDKPEVRETGSSRLEIRTSEPILATKVTIEADLLILSTGIEARDSGGLAELMELPIGDDGFFQETHPKMRPMDFTRAGIYMAGLAHSPRHIFESITQAEGAAVRVAALLGAKEQEAKQSRVSINPRQCSFCGLCVENCAYGARMMEDEKRVAEIVTSLCQGCGVCAMVCPNGTTQQNTFSVKQIMSAIDAAVD